MLLSSDPLTAQDFEDELASAEEHVRHSDLGVSDALDAALNAVASQDFGSDAQAAAVTEARRLFEQERAAPTA